MNLFVVYALLSAVGTTIVLLGDVEDNDVAPAWAYVLMLVAGIPIALIILFCLVFTSLYQTLKKLAAKL